MTRRPACSRWCPFIRDCQDCDWQSLTPAPFIVGVSAGEAACRDAEGGVERERMDACRTNGSAPALLAQNEGLTTGTRLPELDREESPSGSH